MTETCEYADCKCKVTTTAAGGANYCSVECEARDTTDEEMESNCACGHPKSDVQ